MRLSIRIFFSVENFCDIFTSVFSIFNLKNIVYFHAYNLEKCKQPKIAAGSDSKASAYNAGDLGSIPGLGRSPGEGMATHSNTLAWGIPWTGRPGVLKFMGLQRVGHD